MCIGGIVIYPESEEKLWTRQMLSESIHTGELNQLIWLIKKKEPEF